MFRISLLAYGLWYQDCQYQAYHINGIKCWKYPTNISDTSKSNMIYSIYIVIGWFLTLLKINGDFSFGIVMSSKHVGHAIVSPLSFLEACLSTTWAFGTKLALF